MKKLILFLTLTSSLQAYTQTKDSVYNYLVEIGVKHPKIVLKQALLETGRFTSYSCRVRKNLFGLTRNHKLESFSSWKESCDKYVKWVEYKYQSGDYYDFLTDLGYATDELYVDKLKSIKL